MNETIYVSKFYEMNPEDDELLPSGVDLRDGMIVLLEDTLVRGNWETGRELGPYEIERVKECNRWCEVSHITIRRRFEHDEMGAVIAESSPLVSFVATYPDGTKKKRNYDAAYAWLVKRISIPTEGS